MTIKFEINYNENPFCVYYTGQTVKGQAVIHLTEPISVQAIRIRLRGFARVSWEHGDDNYFSHEKYFEETIDCVNTKGSDMMMAVGTYAYNFECVIPPQCPPSFEGTYGRIRYDTKVTLVRGFLLNKSYSKAFNVLAVSDLNRSRHLLYPTSGETIKNFCCGPCKSKPLILTGNIQKTGFVPGDYVSFRARLNNNSSYVIRLLDVSISLLIVYSVKSTKTVKREKISIVKKIYNVVDQSLTDVSDEIQIPPTPPSSEEGRCKILNISYALEVTGIVQGAHINPVLLIPITIGNVPYIESIKLSEESYIADLTESVPKTPEPHSESSIGPLSYEEATYMSSLSSKLDQRKNNDKDSYLEKYVPRYHFYNPKEQATRSSNDENIAINNESR